MSEISSNPVILAIESSADMASAAVITAEGRAVQRVHRARHGHAAQITELARGALAEAGVSADDVTHVAAGRGPGSFTGIRVALAAAKGFVIATGAGGVGVSCLAAMAYAVRDGHGDGGHPVLATADTRRGSFFAQLFGRDGVPLDDISEIDPDAPGACPATWRGALVTGVGATALATAFPDAGLVFPDAGLTGAPTMRRSMPCGWRAWRPPAWRPARSWTRFCPCMSPRPFSGLPRLVPPVPGRRHRDRRAADAGPSCRCRRS